MFILDVQTEDDVKKYNENVKIFPTVVLFYADWCGHCKDLKPTWHLFEKKMRDEYSGPAMIARVNSNVNSQAFGADKIQGYPDIFAIKNDNSKQMINKDYPHDIDSLVSFAVKELPITKKSKKMQIGGRRTRRRMTQKMRKKLRKTKKLTRKQKRQQLHKLKQKYKKKVRSRKSSLKKNR